jgi:YD repeat-containing protein
VERGNVAALVQTLSNVANVTNVHKKIEYDYDLISGKVNQVWYQKGQPDQFAHRYAYDAAGETVSNRLTRAETSLDGLVWQREAEYLYYAHGPLARTELGHYGTQGLDYAYTLQGWLKAVNHPTDAAGDPDGRPGPRGSFAPDAFGYALHYYNGDYQGLGWAGPAFNLAPDRGLYNGNIAAMQTNLGGPGLQAMAYRYDQLNRIRETQAHTWNGTAWAAQADRYRETFQYDPNGNITTLTRHNQAGGAN